MSMPLCFSLSNRVKPYLKKEKFSELKDSLVEISKHKEQKEWRNAEIVVRDIGERMKVLKCIRIEVQEETRENKAEATFFKK